MPSDTGSSAQVLGYPAVSWSQRDERNPIMMNTTNGMMNHMDGWASRWMGGGMWLWTVIGVLAVVLLVVLFIMVSRK